MTEPTLYERLGGEAAVEAAVVRFYDKVLADDDVKHYFDDLDMDRQIRKMIAFMKVAFDGPNEYTGRDLRTAHAGARGQGLDDRHFDVIAERLGETLDELGVEATVRDEVLGIVGGTRDDVLDR